MHESVLPTHVQPLELEEEELDDELLLVLQIINVLNSEVYNDEISLLVSLRLYSFTIPIEPL